VSQTYNLCPHQRHFYFIYFILFAFTTTNSKRLPLRRA